ncbi:MAG: polysaccharide pyruvyl transferase family protein [Candidatus Peribacteraceae bacterium]|nr:polysaccharide pyruvyl transferase family protein [Candidatus Peribacteraceae bacterium]
MRCLLIGNYGVGNLGDEALREYFLREFPEVEWTVLSANPGKSNEVPRLPFGVRSLFATWWRTIGAYRRVDAVVFGGGSLFTDSESSFACLLWWWHAFVARLFRKPLFMAFQGVGPLRAFRSIWLTKWVFGRAAFISVRDEASLKRLKGWNLGTEPILAFDPIFTLFASRKRQVNEQRVLVIIPRDNSGEEFLVAVSGKLANSWDSVRVLLMRPGEEERHVARQIQSMAKAPCQVAEITTQDQLLGEISKANEVVTQRYHGALAAMALDVPVTIVPQSAGDKLQELHFLAGSDKSAEVLLRRVERGIEGLTSALRVVE